MKYMGHKGRILDDIRRQVTRFADEAEVLCDPFCGSSVVAWDFAERFDKPVYAGDLQSFATTRAAAILTRKVPLTNFDFVDKWFDRARDRIERATNGLRVPASPAIAIKNDVLLSRALVLKARGYIEHTLAPRLKKAEGAWPITIAYGGYYFSIQQALALDSLRATLPEDPSERAVSASALIDAASRCSASPGHTAQPLGIKRTSLPHVIDAWNRAIFDYVKDEARTIGSRYARVLGKVVTGSWEMLIGALNPKDVAFCDPPYSDVHYSRFYHVLETLSRGKHIEVFGAGRNPPFSERPASEFSRKSKAKEEVVKLMKLASERQVRLVVTFPVSRQSNRLDAATFARIARRHFSKVDTADVESMFSSLGGNGENGTRPARKARKERIICCYD